MSARKLISAIILTGIFLFLPLPSPPINAAGLQGQVSSDFYITDNNGVSHIRPYERLRADFMAWRDTGGRSLTMHTYVRWTGDFSDSKLTDPQTFVYDAYLKLTGVPGKTVACLGRQFVYNAVGSALLDGVRIKYQPKRSVQIDLFGGSTVLSLDPEKIQSPSDFSTLGGRVSVLPRSSVRLGINWFWRRSEGSTTTHRLGVDGNGSWHAVGLYGRLTYNVAGLRAAEVLVRGSYRPHRWYISGEFDYREPSVSSNSLFSLINFTHYEEIRGEVQRQVWRRLAAVGQLHFSLYEGDDSRRVGLGMRMDNISVIWLHQTGHGGQSNSISGFANIRLTKQWEAFASANAGRYRIQEEQVERSDAYAGGLGVLWRAGHGLTTRLEGQYLRNAMKSRDVRVNLRISKDFSLGERVGSGIL